MSLRPWVWGIGMPNSFCRLGSGTVCPVESWKRLVGLVKVYLGGGTSPGEHGHCLFFDTLDELQSCLAVGHDVLPKLLLIAKLKPNGSAKHPLIWDLLPSDVSSTVSLTERIVLSRVQGAVGPPSPQVHGAMEWLVVDVAHA